MAIWVLEHLPRALGDAPIALLATSRDHEPNMPALDALRRVARLASWTAWTSTGSAACRRRDPRRCRLVRPGRTPGPDGRKSTVRPGAPALARTASGVIGEVLSGRSTGSPPGPASCWRRPRWPARARHCPCSPSPVPARPKSWPPDSIRRARGRARRVSRRRRPLPPRAAGRGGRSGSVTRGAAQSAGGGLADGRRHRRRGQRRPGTVCGPPAAAPWSPPWRRTPWRRPARSAAELVAAGQQGRAAGLLWEARRPAADASTGPNCAPTWPSIWPSMLSWLGDLDPALALYQEAAELARESADPSPGPGPRSAPTCGPTRLCPTLPGCADWRKRSRCSRPASRISGRHCSADSRSSAAPTSMPPIGSGRGRRRPSPWPGPPVIPVLIAQALLDQTSPRPVGRRSTPACVATDEVIRLAERAGRSDLGIAGHQRRAGYYLNGGDLGAASQTLGRAEVLAALQPSPWWRYITLLQRTTLLALSGSRLAATAAMHEAVAVGTGRVEPVVVLGCEALHQLMLFDLYGHRRPADRGDSSDHHGDAQGRAVTGLPGAERVRRPTVRRPGERAGDVAPLRFPTRTSCCARRPAITCCAISATPSPAPARRHTPAPAYRALLPYAGLLNVGGGHSAGLPVDDVLGRLAALDGDLRGRGPARTRRRGAVPIDAVAATAGALPGPPGRRHRTAGDGASRRRGPDACARGRHAGCRNRCASAGRPIAAVDGSPADPSRSASMRRDGPAGCCTSPLGDARLPDSVGGGQLARVLSTPGVGGECGRARGHTGTPIAADLGPGLDARAKREYRRRLHLLQAEHG